MIPWSGARTWHSSRSGSSRIEPLRKERIYGFAQAARGATDRLVEGLARSHRTRPPGRNPAHPCPWFSPSPGSHPSGMRYARSRRPWAIPQWGMATSPAPPPARRPVRKTPGGPPSTCIAGMRALHWTYGSRARTSGRTAGRNIRRGACDRSSLCSRFLGYAVSRIETQHLAGRLQTSGGDGI
jgi:hypothetical protein